MFCSMICVTESSTLLAAAPGYSALMAMDGGAMVGYGVSGSRRMATRPSSESMIASTQANIGRSMKKRDI